jgi:hypothetical protein
MTMLFRTSMLFAAALVAVGSAPAEAKDNRRYDDRGYQYQNRGMDHNRDGVVTQREWRGSDAAFRRQDRNRDGVLSHYELNSGRDGYYDRNDGRRDDRYSRGDNYYGNGAITRGEWRGGRQDFERLDRNRNGVLTRDELRDWR